MAQPSQSDLISLASKFWSRNDLIYINKNKQYKQIIPLLELISKCRIALQLPENASCASGELFASECGALLICYGIHSSQDAVEFEEFIDIFYEEQPQMGTTMTRLLTFLAELARVEINNLLSEPNYENHLLYRQHRNFAVANLVAWYQSYCSPKAWLELVYQYMSSILYGPAVNLSQGKE